VSGQVYPTPVTPWTVGGTGIATLATAFLESNDHPMTAALVGAVLIGWAARLRYRRFAAQAVAERPNGRHRAPLPSASLK
jgi:hypothetical protein